MSCEWPVDRARLPALPELGDPPTQDQQTAYDAALADRNAAEDLAVSVLWALSGRQFGLCDTLVRPCPDRCGPYPLMTPYVLTLDAGRWVNLWCGCLGSCVVSGPRVVHLPGPVDSIVDVKIAGISLAGSDYQLEGDALYRTGGAAWPSQDLGRPLGEAGTWSVTYKLGYAVPAGVDRLTGQLAREFLMAWTNAEECRLPRTVVSTVRQGVTHRFDPSKVFADGKTGLTEIDSWLASVNPNHLMAASVVL